jgi:hypothetical protein
MPPVRCLPISLAACLILVLPPVSAAEPGRVEIRPKETDELLANPGMGWQTFHQFVVHDKNLQGLPSSSAYYRFYWREIEPRDGEPDFAKLDGLLALGRRVGQKLAMRIMVTGSDEPSDCPDWLREAGCKGTDAIYGGKKHWIPDLADPVFQEKHFALIRKLGERYNGHPDLDLVDIGTVGLWGEWHLSDVTDAATGKPVPMATQEVQNAIVDAWVAAFPKTPKVALVGSDVGMARTAKEGLGWRADCFGDLGMFSKNWNHMEHYYPQQLQKFSAEDAWKRGPVAFESCGDMRDWTKNGWKIGDIFDYGLAQHASYLNNKSAPLPDGARPVVERFLRKLGYRLVLRHLAHDETAEAGGNLPVSFAWENVGVAPPYRDYRVAIRLRNLGTQTKSAFLQSDESIRGWLPGQRSTEYAFALPADIQAGEYELAIGIVDAETTTPAVKLAIEGRDASGWYPLSTVTVKN